jgi:hypothetical protein
MTKPFLGPKKAMVMHSEASDFTLNYIHREEKAEMEGREKTKRAANAKPLEGI